MFSRFGKMDATEGIPSAAWTRKLTDEFKPHKEFDVSFRLI